MRRLGYGAFAGFEQGSGAHALGNAGAISRQEYLSPDAVGRRARLRL